MKWMRPTQSRRPEPAGGGPSLPSDSSPAHPLSLSPSALPRKTKKTACFDTNQPPWLHRHLEVIIQQRTPQKRHLHNETSHFSRRTFLPTCVCHACRVLLAARLPFNGGSFRALARWAGLPEDLSHPKIVDRFFQRGDTEAPLVCSRPYATSPP